ncbi:hypothetical protein AUC61_17240 [Pseudomonas sp. S25]|uniref:Uncharacterized protein n=1 Tax=Pseudomonas maioricensis TaxID=1766623 RepID=A0ABS9ZL20_9PSED|nr:hypothetical protein [Pseudomonas sp. S25]
MRPASKAGVAILQRGGMERQRRFQEISDNRQNRDGAASQDQNPTDHSCLSWNMFCRSCRRLRDINPDSQPFAAFGSSYKFFY